MRRTFGIRIATLILLSVVVSPVVVTAQGIFLPAGGAVNRGMGGATTGAGIEAIGSMYWNPATIGQLDRNEVAFGFDAIFTNFNISSTFPGAGSGSSNSDIGVNAVPTIAWVHHTENPNVTLGLGVFGVAGFSTNVPGNSGNPIVSPPFAQGGAGVGRIRSEATFLQFNPAITLQLTERLSIGGGPVVGLGKVSFDDNVFAPLNANGLYPRGDGTRNHWGLGAQLGVHYVHNETWQFGANIKSPTWFQPFRYYSENAVGLPRTDEVNVDLPLIASAGVACNCLPGTIFTADVRYFDYTSTDGFGDRAAYRADGSVIGLGWKDQFSVAMGIQHHTTSRLTCRLGYIYASDLIDNSTTFFNVGSDLSYRHVPTMGATYHVNANTALSFGYQYVIDWGSTGPYVLPGVGAVPGSSVTTRLNSHIATAGVNIAY